MLTVQIVISRVEADVRNGISQRRYQGNTTGAQKRDAAMGQANTSAENSGDALLKYIAIANPTSTASPTSTCGDAMWCSNSKTGPLKRKPLTYAPSEPS